jgi:hypothetical protein
MPNGAVDLVHGDDTVQDECQNASISWLLPRPTTHKVGRRPDQMGPGRSGREKGRRRSSCL